VSESGRKPRFIVCDSTCLIALERIRRLELLPELFGEIFVPPAVAGEFGGDFAWLKVQRPADANYVAALKLQLDDGEAEAIALAKELGCVVILDDLPARRVARMQNQRFVGLIRLLMLAKTAGKLAAIRPVIESLRAAGFFMSEALVAEALRLARE
jgi:predicted nucleic acid-binding protein